MGPLLLQDLCPLVLLVMTDIVEGIVVFEVVAVVEEDLVEGAVVVEEEERILKWEI